MTNSEKTEKFELMAADDRAMMLAGEDSLFLNVAKFEQMQRAAAMLAKADFVPAAFKGNIGNCMIALDLAERMRAHPIMLMQTMYVVHGRPGFEGKFVSALVNNSGRYDGKLKYEWKGKKGTSEWGCRAWAKLKGSDEVVHGPWVDWEMVTKEGWHKKPGSKWITMPEVMFMYRAASFFGKTHDSDLLMGMQTIEELEDMEAVPMIRSASGTFTDGQAKKTPELYEPTQKKTEVVNDAKPIDNGPVEADGGTGDTGGGDAGQEEEEEAAKDDPTSREAWFGQRTGTPAKGTGLKAYVLEHQAAFEKVWPSWSDEQKAELKDKYGRFYDEHLPWIEKGIDKIFADESGQHEDGAGDQQTNEPADKSVPFDRFNEAWAYGDKQAKAFANDTLGLPAGKRPEPEQYKTWLTYFDAKLKKINDAQKTAQGERDSDKAIDPRTAQKWCDDHPVMADPTDYSEEELLTIKTAAASLNCGDMSDKTWSEIHEWVQAMLQQGEFEDLKGGTPGESGPGSSESDGADLETVERFNELFMGDVGSPAWWYAQEEAMGTKTKKRPDDDKIEQWLIDYDEFVKNMM